MFEMRRNKTDFTRREERSGEGREGRRWGQGGRRRKEETRKGLCETTRTEAEAERLGTSLPSKRISPANLHTPKIRLRN